MAHSMHIIYWALVAQYFDYCSVVGGSPGTTGGGMESGHSMHIIYWALVVQ